MNISLLLRIVLSGVLIVTFAANSWAQTRTPNKAALFEMLRSTEPDARVRSGVAIFSNFSEEKGRVHNMMLNDSSRDVRRRLAQVLAERDKDPDAIVILEKVLKENDISKHKGAEEALTAAGALTAATGKPHGIDNALSILGAPPHWFSDVDTSVHAVSLKDSVRVMAASFLSQQGSSVPKEKYRKGLETYCQDVEKHILQSSGEERKYWEARLPTILNIALRAGLPDIALKFDGKAELFKEKYERDRFERVIEKAKGKSK